MSKGKKKKEKQKEKQKKKEKKNQKKKWKEILKSFLKWIIGTVILGTCLTVFITIKASHHLPPMYTQVFTLQDDLIQGQIDQSDEICNMVFLDSVFKLKIYLDNNNDSSIRITDICVNVIKYEYIEEKDIHINRECIESGSTKEPINLKTSIKPCIGSMKTEIDWNLNSKYEKGINTDSFIEIANNSSEKFMLSMDFEKQGYYNIEVEFTYMYNGKTQTIKTDPLNYIFLEKRDEG